MAHCEELIFKLMDYTEIIKTEGRLSLSIIRFEGILRTTFFQLGEKQEAQDTATQ